MIYLTGITISNWKSKKTRKFKKLHIPFNSEKELEKLRLTLELRKNKRHYPNMNIIERERYPKIRVSFMIIQSHEGFDIDFKKLNDQAICKPE